MKKIFFSGCFGLFAIIGLLSLLGIAGGIYSGVNDYSMLSCCWESQDTRSDYEYSPSESKKKELNSNIESGGIDNSELEISLFWNNKNNYDLVVFCPNDDVVWNGKMYSNSGGVHKGLVNEMIFTSDGDIDKTATLNRNRANPVEQIIWSSGNKPIKGIYKVFVLYKDQILCDTPVELVIRVVNQDETSFFKSTETGSAINSMCYSELVYEELYRVEDLKKAYLDGKMIKMLDFNYR
jgi:hypothetical protein